MHPRFKTSKKWTPLPKDFLNQIRSVFKQNFLKEIGKGTVETDGRIYPDEILVQIGIRPETGLKQSNFEISIAYKKDKDNVLKLLHMAVDAAASLFEQLFQAENDHDFPRIWQEFEIEGRAVFAQYTTTNNQLEQEANKLLGEYADEGLAGGDWEDETSAEEIKARLGIDPDDEDIGEGEDAIEEAEDDADPKKRH